MSIELKVYDNGDHTCLVWLPEDGKPIANCRGFTARRTKQGAADVFLHGFVGFADADKLDPANPWKFPLQRFMWWDYLVTPGDTVQYQVIPVVGPNKDNLTLDLANASPLTPQLTISGQCTPHLSAFFNKGIVAAQWVSRALAKEDPKAKIRDLVAKTGDPLRNELSGLLRPAILSHLAAAQQQQGKIFAALYELNDPELIPALEAFGANCSLILANGAFGPGKPDENAAVRKQLRGDGKIQVFDRMVGSGHFAHNKFVVVCDSGGQPQSVITGSTNWTTSGLCTQANNGLIIDDAAVAADFLDAWNRIKAAGNDYPASLVTPNSTAKTFQVDGCQLTPWFVKTSAAQDLDFARKLINGAKEGILFLFFNPGSFQKDPSRWTLLQNILERHHQANNPDFNPNLYIRGVVNQDIAELTKPGAPNQGQQPAAAALDPNAPAPVDNPVTLYSNGVEPPQRLTHDVLVPHNIKTGFHDWEKELLGASMVDIHSKVIVLDPFGEHPVVMTGSHNLGFKASNANDDNLVIIEGNAPLAAAYAINIVAIFQTYRWNSYVEQHRQDPQAFHGLVDTDQWQASYLAGDQLAETEFWLGQAAASAPAPATVPAAGVPAAGLSAPAPVAAAAAPAAPAAPAVPAASAASPPPAKPPRHAAHAVSTHPAGAPRARHTRQAAAPPAAAPPAAAPPAAAPPAAAPPAAAPPAAAP
jgi:phosphatidylserine/phosphatidylglycerophosphate/cardiolipin synthase-like enzyme